MFVNFMQWLHLLRKGKRTKSTTFLAISFDIVNKNKMRSLK